MEGNIPPRKTLMHTLRVIRQLLPVRLLTWHLREHLGLLIIWLLLFMLIFRVIGMEIGIPYLFLEPEYLGETGFMSMMILGACTGVFTGAYQISSFLHDSYRYEFLVHEKRPFFTFCINNFFIPVLFLVAYGVAFMTFSMSSADAGIAVTGVRLIGFYTGVVLMTLAILGLVYRFNRMPLMPSDGLQEQTEYLRRRHRRIRKRNMVSYYLSDHLSWKVPSYDQHVSNRFLAVALHRHHASALIIELLLIANVVVAGALEHLDIFQIPAGGSILVILAILMLLMGAFSFWFRRIAPIFLVIAGLLLLRWAGNGLFMRFNPASGMSYEHRVPYVETEVDHRLSAAAVRVDSLCEIRILERWRSRQDTLNGKPVMTILCSSGGGLRSAYFTFHAMRQLDSISDGRFYRSVYLHTGASGGMVAAAFYRELTLSGTNLQDPDLSDRIASDLLNRLGFRLATGMLAPEIAGYSWLPDRGYSFDDQLAENLGIPTTARLADYAGPESLAVCPRLILSPTIMNDATRLYISSIPAAWLTRDRIGTHTMQNGIDLLRFFDGCDPEQLSYITALRMNATFPVITPYVELPSDPPLFVMDAGASDNHGLQTAVKFLSVFRPWLDQNCSVIRIVHLRDSPVSSMPVSGNFSGNLDPVAGVYGSLTASKNYLHRELLESVSGGYSFARLDYIPVTYISSSQGYGASLSWHLTPMERRDIESCLKSQAMAELLQRLIPGR